MMLNCLGVYCVLGLNLVGWLVGIVMSGMEHDEVFGIVGYGLFHHARRRRVLE